MVQVKIKESNESDLQKILNIFVVRPFNSYVGTMMSKKKIQCGYLLFINYILIAICKSILPCKSFSMAHASAEDDKTFSRTSCWYIKILRETQ